MTRRDQIRNAYRLTGNNASFYDGMMTYSTLPGKVICRLVWNMDGKKNLRYLERALSGVPEDIYHVSPHETRNPDEFVTEICYPVKKIR